MTIWRRLRYGSSAMLAGWSAALVATFPFQVEVARRNGDGDPRLTMNILGLGMIVWSVWTLAWALGGLAVSGPILMVVSPRWMLRHRRKLMLWIIVASIAVWVWKFDLWKMVGPLHDYDLHVFWLYLIWTLSYSLTTFALYLRLVRRVGRHSVHDSAHQPHLTR